MAKPDDSLSHDPAADAECSLPDDFFVPVRAGELGAALADDANRFAADPDALRRVADAIEDVIDQEASAFERGLADRYAAFNPDRDTLPQTDAAGARCSIRCRPRSVP